MAPVNYNFMDSFAKSILPLTAYTISPLQSVNLSNASLIYIEMNKNMKSINKES